MIVDDRLETVLRTNVAGKTAARTQLRQLIDLLGAVPLSAWNTRHASALARVEALCNHLDDEETAAVLRGVPHRSAVLVYHFAQGGRRAAAAAVASADLSEDDWLALIPRLPMIARGFVRHRSGLPQAVRKLLSDLGVNDFLLPEPQTVEDGADAMATGAHDRDEPVPQPFVGSPVAVLPANELPLSETQAAKSDSDLAPESAPGFTDVVEDAATAAPATTIAAPFAPLAPPQTVPVEDTATGLEDDGIGAIVRRIEAFRRKRDERDVPSHPKAEGLAPLLPFPEPDMPAPKPPEFIDLRTDADGVIVHAAIDPPGMLIGARIFSAAPEAPLRCDSATIEAVRRRQPVEAARIEVAGAPAVAGTWYADGPPIFAPDGGRFCGYLLRLRRSLAAVPVASVPVVPGRSIKNADTEADRMRQLLHELRTPINAIQGFAEMIQSQVFGPTPHQYRAMAATIAADAAQMLAGFEEVERLVKLESAALTLETGGCDAAIVISRLVEQVSPVLSSRNVRLTVSMPASALPVDIAEAELERCVWRVLSVIAASVAPGERLTFSLEDDAGLARLALTLPVSLRSLDDEALYAPDAAPATGMLTAAMLGNGFALRLARAEVRAAGGSLEREAGLLLATFPGHVDETPAWPGHAAGG